MLPGKPGDVGVTAKDNRLFVDAVLYRYRAGIPWRDLPARFGDFKVADATIARPSARGWGKRGAMKPSVAPSVGWVQRFMPPAMRWVIRPGRRC